MITEDYVSFKVAKLLKDKGFVESCLYYYFSDGIKMYKSKGLKHRNSSSVSTYSTPTHQMAMKWLREVHNINIEIRCYKNIVEAFIMTIEDLPKCLVRGISSNNYEETVEAALKHCLENLI